MVLKDFSLKSGLDMYDFAEFSHIFNMIGISKSDFYSFKDWGWAAITIDTL